METYRCPVCKKPLTKKEYERALGILGEREKHLEAEKAMLRRRLQVAEARVKKARQEGIDRERARTQRLLAGKEKQIKILKDRLEQLKKGTTPQTEGLEFEENLATRLEREFPDDDIKHAGRGGDVLHVVYFGKQRAGLIVYECKRTPRIDHAHIRQAHLARQDREADFAVLVTTGSRKGFSGLAQIEGVLVVAPLGTIPLAALLRQHIIEKVKARITKEERTRIAEQLAKYITSPQFKNPIDEVVSLSAQLQGMIREEAKEHFRVWRKRWDHYQRIQWDSSQVRQNVQLVLHGKEPTAGVPPKMEPLQLPEFAD